MGKDACVCRLCLAFTPFLLLIDVCGLAASDGSYSLEAFTQEKEKTYIIGREFLSMSHSYEHKYRAYPPFFRALEADDDTQQMNECYFGKTYEEEGE